MIKSDRAQGHLNRIFKPIYIYIHTYMFSIFKDYKLKVTIEGNVTVTEFLDVYFDLGKESFKPYRKKQ